MMKSCFMWFYKVIFLLFAVLALSSDAAVVAQPGAGPGQIAFVANLKDNWDIFLVDSNGRNLVQLTDTSYDENEPRWSADRKRIVYSASDGKLYVIDIKTKEFHQVPAGDNDGKMTSPSFSPDGKKIVYVHFKPERVDDTELAIFDFEHNANTKFIDQFGPLSFPSWSPDDKYIVYTAAYCSTDCGRIIQELWIATTKGHYARQLLMTNSHCMQPVWSPDGKKIAFASDKGGNFDIWTLSLENWDLKQLTKDAHLDMSPAWSSDGRSIAFVSARTGKSMNWIIDLKTGKLKMLSPFKDKNIECRDVAW
jgi:TolB protein